MAIAPDDPHDDATVAALFRAALALGVATPADLVPWADGQVLARERAAEWVIDLSLGAGLPADQVAERLRDVAAGADPAVVFRLIVGLADVSDRWTAAMAWRAADWLWAVANQFAADGATVSLAGAYADEFWLADTDHAAHPSTPAVVAELTAAVVALFRAHADPAARAWLPGVRLTFDA